MSDLLQLFFNLLELLTDLLFLAVFSEKKGRPCWYLFFSVTALLLVNLPPVGQPFRLVLLLFLLVGAGVYGLQISFGTALAHAALVLEITQLAWGISDSVMTLLFPLLFPAGPPFSFSSLLFQIYGSILALALTFSGCLSVHRYAPGKTREAGRYFSLVLAPLLLIFLISWHIVQDLYGSATPLRSTSAAYHFRLLGIQLLSAASIFCILYAFMKLAHSIRQETELSLLEQQNLFLRQYVEEARSHEQETRSLHHDMKNHLAVLKGFLEQGEPEKANAYIADLNISLESASFPFRTGRAVVDILLKTKLAEPCRRGVRVDCSLQIPPSCRISDMDLCILLANALDNALHACEKTAASEKFLRLSGRSQGDFLCLRVENSFDGNPEYERGTGLDNIHRIAEKYEGLMEIITEGPVFCLHVLLLSQEAR